MPVSEIVILLVLGLVAGAFGGLLGIGGSVIMIPVLTLVLGRDQHVSQAAAMIVNTFVAVPALIRHSRKGVVRWDVFMRMLPAAIILILVGVQFSNAFEGRLLERFFAVFLLYVVIFNIQRLISGAPEPTVDQERTGWTPSSSVGGIMGFMAGLLGIGGGAIAVPLVQRICNLPLRQSIGTITAVMCITSVIGAVRKNVTLADVVTSTDEMPVVIGSLIIAACLIPTAIAGSLLGSGLTHILPLKYVRVAFILLMFIVSLKMFGVF